MPIKRKPVDSWRLIKDMKEDCNAEFPKKNTVFVNKGDETIEHIMVKTLIMHLLRNENKEAYCEVKLGAGIVDIFDLTRQIIIEVETNLTEEGKRAKVEKYDSRYVTDFIFIDLNKIPTGTMREVYEYLKPKIIDVKSD